MALSEGLKGFVNFFAKSFNDGENEEDAFTGLINGDDEYETDGTLALNRDRDLDSMYGTRVNSKPERSFERESKVVSHPNSYKSGEVTVIEPRSFSEAAQIVKKLIDKTFISLITLSSFLILLPSSSYCFNKFTKIIRFAGLRYTLIA